jgi:hypothetical protein
MTRPPDVPPRQGRAPSEQAKPATKNSDIKPTHRFVDVATELIHQLVKLISVAAARAL